MTSPIAPITPAAAPGAAAPSSANATTAGAVASANAPAEITANTKINSLEDLKKKSPKLYRKMMEGIGMQICGEMREHQDRLKKLMREASDQR